MSLDYAPSPALGTGLPDGSDHPQPLANLAEAAALMKTLGHDGRLAILCHLAEGERSVTALERLLGQRQAAVSQQLARLRMEGLVATRREGKVIFYSLTDPKVAAMVGLLHELYGRP
jgi:ArsR family transcriptional regulator